MAGNVEILVAKTSHPENANAILFSFSVVFHERQTIEQFHGNLPAATILAHQEAIWHGILGKCRKLACGVITNLESTHGAN